MNKVLACIDGSVYSQSVSDHAVWAARRLEAPLEFLHVMNRHPETAATRDLSGNIGLGSQDNLLSELALLDEKRSKLAQQHGREMLDRVVRQARGQRAANVEPRLRHGALVDTLTELEKEVRLFVLGKRDEHVDFAKLHLGSELERAVRAVHRPLLGIRSPQRHSARARRRCDRAIRQRECNRYPGDGSVRSFTRPSSNRGEHDHRDDTNLFGSRTVAALTMFSSPSIGMPQQDRGWGQGHNIDRN